MFSILKQKDRDNGCIPACAASVLRHMNIAPCIDEESIMHMYDDKTDTRSGFEKLRAFLKPLPELSAWSIEIQGVDASTKTFIINMNKEDKPILFHVDQGSSQKGHCVVVADSDDNRVKIFDPGNGVSEHRYDDYDKFLARARSFLWFDNEKLFKLDLKESIKGSLHKSGK